MYTMFTLAINTLMFGQALAHLPPAQEFTPARGGQGKSTAVLVISAFNNAQNPKGTTSRTGSELIRNCIVMLCWISMPGPVHVVF